MRQVGRYSLDEKLAQGGMGAVYAARDPETGDALAIKLLLAGRSASEEQRRRFARETEALRKLRHPGLVEVVDAGLDIAGSGSGSDSETDRVPWVAMRYVEGVSLEERLRRRGPLEVGEVIEIARQVAEAMAEAHRVGVLHRDLKPDNILATPGGHYVVTDFGLAKDLEVEESQVLSKTGGMMGTPGYWAPEQAEGLGKTATPATDVYGLGATLYALLAGRPPFCGGTLLEAVVAAIEQPPPPLREFRSDVPRWLKAVVLRCLEKAPAARFAGMRELLPSLVQPAHVSRRLALPAIAAGSILALAVGGAFLILATSPDRSLPVAEESSRARLERTAEGGDVAAMIALAELLQESPDAPTRAVAAGWYERAAVQGSAEAAAVLGLALCEARWDRWDDAEGLRWLSQAAELGHVRAMTELGTLLATGRGGPGRQAESNRWLRRAADAKDSEAMNKLARRLVRGLGGPADRPAALLLARESAELDDPDGKTILGTLLISAGRQGVSREQAERVQRGEDPAEGPTPKAEVASRAVELWRQAAAHGHGTALYNLGASLVSGVSGPEDLTGGLPLLRRALHKGPASSAGLAAVAIATLAPPELLAAAEADHPVAMWALAGRLWRGEGLEANPSAAATWLRKAAAAGDLYAQVDLFSLLLEEPDLARDPQEGLRALQSAAARGLPSAMTPLGDTLAGEEAVRWYRRAAEAGDLPGTVALARCLWEGRGVARDEVAAIRWLLKTAEFPHPQAMLTLGQALARRAPTPMPDQARHWLGRAAQFGSEDVRERAIAELQRIRQGDR